MENVLDLKKYILKFALPWPPLPHVSISLDLDEPPLPTKREHNY